MRLGARIFVLVAAIRITDEPRHGRARRSGAGRRGPASDGDGRSGGAKSPGLVRTDSLPDFSTPQWLLAAAAGFGVGLSKGGLAGVGLFHVVVFAFLFGARESTGIVLPLLLIADVCAVTAFQQHARWDYVRRMLPPACVGVIVAALFMRGIDERAYKSLIGWTVLALAALQLWRMQD